MQQILQKSYFRYEIESLKAEEQETLAQRAQHPYKMTIGEMPENARYNKPKTERKH